MGINGGRQLAPGLDQLRVVSGSCPRKVLGFRGREVGLWKAVVSFPHLGRSFIALCMVLIFFFLIDWLVWGLEEREGTQRALKTPD